MKVTQNSIDRANKMLDDINGTPTIGEPTVNNLTIINMEDNSPQAIASRERVQKAVYNLLNKAKNMEVIDQDSIELKPEDIKEESIIEEKVVEETNFKLKQNEGED